MTHTPAAPSRIQDAAFLSLIPPIAYTGKDTGESGDEQFEISDGRSFDQMYNDMESEGLQPVLNDYVYV